MWLNFFIVFLTKEINTDNIYYMVNGNNTNHFQVLQHSIISCHINPCVTMTKYIMYKDQDYV